MPRGPLPRGDWADFALAIGIVGTAFLSISFLGFGWWLLFYGMFPPA